MNLIKLGQQLRNERRAAGLSQKEVSERAGVDRSTISKLERLLGLFGQELVLTPVKRRRPTLYELFDNG